MALSPTWSLLCSNRTFMELKYLMHQPLVLRIVSSNRTFMELKYIDKEQERAEGAFQSYLHGIEIKR